jgi:hypothetical protein
MNSEQRGSEKEASLSSRESSRERDREVVAGVSLSLERERIASREQRGISL